MKSKRMILFKTMLMSTSQINKIKYCKDKKKRGQAIGTIVGMLVVYLMIVFYCVLMSVGYGKIGLTSSIPTICAMMISFIAFLFTVFRTNGYLINFKEYDMLMSLPFKVKNIVADKFIYMYVQLVPWFISVSLAMLIGYGIFEKPNVIVYPLWIVLSLVLPVIPMLVAAFIGFIIAKISSGFKKTNIVQTIIMFAFVIFCFSLQFIIDAMAKKTEVAVVLTSLSDKIDSVGKYYLPIMWFKSAIVGFAVSDILLLIGITLIVFEAVFAVLGKSYRRLNSALKAHASAKAYDMSAQRKSSVLNSIAFKEFKRLTGSTVYMVNGALGEVLSLLFGIVVLIVGFDKVIATVTKGAPLTTDMLYPAIPLIVYFLIGMVATTTCSPSLEGKNYWIVQSLPIDRKVLYQGKMLFNMYLSVPFALFATICISISAGVPILNFVIYIVETIVLCAFSTTWGCVCGLKFMRLDWENEIEVVKQGAAVIIYLLPNMFVTMGVVVLTVYLGTRMDGNIVSLIVTAVYGILAAISYFMAISMARNQK